jgi:alkanesulfonate monooxygenase SsuD/methylene tetrahydromethanopterin reductase-like flavin-dependent oxidoreductase (luciferase family)
MKFAVDISPAGPWGDPRTLAELAALAERSGWDGVFLEDYVFYPGGLDTYDPWVTLAAIALATERIRLGTMITPLPRRRPWKVAAEAMTVDRLSGGRMILGVGSGDPASVDMTRLGEAEAARTRAAMLDEALEVIDGLWRGEPLSFEGANYSLDDAEARIARSTSSSAAASAARTRGPRSSTWARSPRREPPGGTSGCRRRRRWTRSAPSSQAGRFARATRWRVGATRRAHPRPRGATA